MNELLKIIFGGIILLLLNLLVLKVFPSLNMNFNGLDMYILYLNVIFALYIILPSEVGGIFKDLGK
jgi:hypothetical protein